MTDYRQVLGPLPGVLVRQKLRLKNLCACLLRNKYQIGTFPAGAIPGQPWEDDVFKRQQGLMYATEHSEVINKVCCHRWREFNMSVHAGGDSDGPTLLRFHRPFKCPLLCCCTLPWPQEIHAYDGSNQHLGMVVQDWRCCEALCGKTYWKAYDAYNTPTHVFKRDVCCNSNCIAPSCCAPIHKISIKNADETEVVGLAENIFPGCTIRTCCFGNMIDNYRLTFPQDSTPENKATLLAGLILLDFMLFANADENNNDF